MTARRRLPPRTPVTHSRSGWTGVVVRFVDGPRGLATYRVRWDRTGAESSVAPRYVEPGADVDPAGRSLARYPAPTGEPR